MIKIKPIFTLASLLTAAACLPMKHEVNSKTKGYSSGQLDQYEQKTGNAVYPQYPQLFSLVGNQKLVKMAIFIAYDKVEPEQFAAGAIDKSFVDPRSAGPHDYAASAFNSLIDWFKDAPDSVLKNARLTPIKDLPGAARFGVVIEGKGPGIAKQAGTMQWQVSIQLGIAGDPTFARDFGAALATNHIAMLNGHFYPQDAQAAYQEQEGGQFSSPSFYDQPYFQNMRSRIYVPARDAFVAKARAIQQEEAGKGLDIPRYQIAVFNGCGSEQIEDLFLKGASSVGRQKLDIVGMRGFSNYRNFGQQIARFVRSLYRGDKWSTVIQSFRYEKALDAADLGGADFYGMPTSVCPVFRNNEIGADGDRHDLSGCVSSDLGQASGSAGQNDPGGDADGQGLLDATAAGNQIPRD